MNYTLKILFCLFISNPYSSFMKMYSSQKDIYISLTTLPFETL